MAVLDRAAVLLQTSQFAQIGSFLDQAELESLEPNVLEDWPHALHMLAHIYQGNLTDARFLWKRLPQAVKTNNPELLAAFKLLQFYWNKHYIGVWQALQGYQWSAQLVPLIDALAMKLRGQMLDLVSTAYSTVTAGKVAILCGMSEQQAAAQCKSQGWQQDAATGVFTVVPKRPAAAAQGGLGSLEQLAGYMLHLEGA